MVLRRDCVTLADLIERANDYQAYIRVKMSFRPSPTMALMAGTAHVGRKRHDSSHTTPRGLIVGRGIRLRQPGARERKRRRVNRKFPVRKALGRITSAP